MNTGRMARRLAAVAGGSALIALGALTAGCSSSESPAPSSTTSTTTSVSPSPTPTEKGVNPTGGNSFSPGVKAPPLPTGNPGNTSHTG